MAKYAVYGIISATKYMGEIEASSMEEAQEMADGMDTHISLCHQCSHEVDAEEIYKFDVELIK